MPLDVKPREPATPSPISSADPPASEFDDGDVIPPRHRAWPWVTATLVVVAVAIGGYGWWQQRAEQLPKTATPGAAKGLGSGGFDAAARALPVIAESVREGSIDVYLNALGTVTPLGIVTVKPRVDGQLMKLYFEEGQFVKAGQPLADIDPRPFEVQLGQAQGQLAKDQALAANAQVDLERYRTLLAQDSIARQQVDTQESLVRQYQATIKADQAAVDQAKLQLTYAKVTAPISGRAGLRQVDPGNVVHASDANGIVVIAQLQPISVVFSIPEDSVPLVMRRLAHGLPTAVEAWDREGKRKLATGKLVAADNQIDPATGTVKVKAQFANADNELFPNQFVNVRVLTQTLDHAILVPAAAIQRGAPGTFVYVVKDDRTVTVAPVKLGPTQGETQVVTSGVQPGAMVVVDGADKLREGAKVELTTREGQAVAPARHAEPRAYGGGRRGAGGNAGTPAHKAP